MMDGCQTNWITLCEECHRAFWACPKLRLGRLGHFFFLENKLICYADDSTLIAVVTSPGVRVTVAESLLSDLDRVNETLSKTMTILAIILGKDSPAPGD